MDGIEFIFLPCLDTGAFELSQEEEIENLLAEEERIIRDKVYPELEWPTLQLIQKRLGYIPRPYLTFPVEPDLRHDYHRYICGNIDLDDLYFKTDELLKVIRNWDLHSDYQLLANPSVCEYFQKNYLFYMQKAYDRISLHLGYKPDHAHSLAAQIWLGQILSKEHIILPATLTPYDYRALSSVRYKELLMTEGEEAANHSPLLAMQAII
ncbi:hypothetical protein [Emticicia sp. BO119]|uniref:hypothetical protein n=1 Tax=Emticicia sp. BO119 TaxID=2757768 RepID=UPI0015F06F75|nr:hypothetical protein [Emticicia sp. BO119]MBA4853751.1 hypothetical protein [Emticicia sp. BO119]